MDLWGEGVLRAKGVSVLLRADGWQCHWLHSTPLLAPRVPWDWLYPVTWAAWGSPVAAIPAHMGWGLKAG